MEISGLGVPLSTCSKKLLFAAIILAIMVLVLAFAPFRIRPAVGIFVEPDLVTGVVADVVLFAAGSGSRIIYRPGWTFRISIVRGLISQLLFSLTISCVARRLNRFVCILCMVFFMDRCAAVLLIRAPGKLIITCAGDSSNRVRGRIVVLAANASRPARVLNY